LRCDDEVLHACTSIFYLYTTLNSNNTNLLQMGSHVFIDNIDSAFNSI
jgi:hypothetical protein